MEENVGYVYIMTNPGFKEYVKIGYAKNVEERLNTLNASSAVPFSFRVYATYKVTSELSDKEVHKIIDNLNPELRTKENEGGKKRVREFFTMTPERAFSILESIAKINGLEGNLKKNILTNKDKQEEKIADEVIKEHTARGEVFSFKKCNIPVGAELEYVNDSAIKCRVVDDRRIEYRNEIMYLTGLAKKLLNKSRGIAGPLYFKYKGKNLQAYYEEHQKKTAK